MKISKEHNLAIKITFLLLLFGGVFLYLLPTFRHLGVLESGYNSGQNKYFFLAGFVILTYIISYIIAKISIKPLYNANEKLREYNHHLAHEIKTPLAVLSSNLELLVLQPNEKKYIFSSQEEIQKMRDITDTLLFLSESRKLFQGEEISFFALLQEYKDDFLEIDFHRDFVISGEKKLIETVIKNLVENAKKYAKAGTKLHIKIFETSVIFENEFSGNFEKKDVKNLGETFYRGKNVGDQEGYGLGLSLVKKILDLHHLTFSLKISENIFRVEIKK